MTEVDGLQTLLNSKQDTWIAGTSISIVGNTINNAYSYTHPLTHTIAEITNLQASLNAKRNTSMAGANMSIVGNTINSTYSYTHPSTHTIAEVWTRDSIE